ncbi:MAG: hypothetical protein JXJ20_04885 [Anaerolineae bacterium]|nr:hypothetical protein [Anaerolineae bacterium]
MCIKLLRDWLNRWLTPSQAPADATLARAVEYLRDVYGVRVMENDPKGRARSWRRSELVILTETLHLLGPAFYKPFLDTPLHIWIDRKPGGGTYGNHWLRIGEPGRDVSILYRIILHEGTHASNEYRGWPYETRFCTKPGLDWRKVGGEWVHPRQQGKLPEPGDWETLPVDARDVSTSPAEDLAETVRYFVHSVRDEREWLWPLDKSRPPIHLWDTSPTRFVYVRDHFLVLPDDHPWYKRLAPAVEARAAANLAG